MNPSPRDLGTLRKRERIGALIYLPMFLVGTQFLAVLIVLLFDRGLSQDEALGPVNLAYTALNALALVLIFRHYLLEQSRRIQARGWALFADLLLAFLVYYGLSVLAANLILLLQDGLGVEYANANQDAILAALRQSPLYTILAACVLAPIGEELLFRGLLFCGLYRKSRAWAYAVSMLCFALAHLYSSMFSQPTAVTLMALVVYLPHGFALAWIYERSGSIWSAVFLHAGLNTFSFLLLFANR